MIKAILIDRDGTLIDEPETDVVNNWSLFKLKDDIGALANLKEKYKIFIITNQEGINDGRLPQDFYNSTNKRLLEALKEKAVYIEKIYTCPHAIAENCECRKPNKGLINQLLKDYKVDLEKSYIIGDRESDIKLGKSIGSRTIFIKSKHHQISPELKPDFITNNLMEAVTYINKNI